MADKNPKHPLKKKQAKAKDKKKHIYEQVNTKDKNPVGSLMRTGRVLLVSAEDETMTGIIPKKEILGCRY